MGLPVLFKEMHEFVHVILLNKIRSPMLLVLQKPHDGPGGEIFIRGRRADGTRRCPQAHYV